MQVLRQPNFALYFTGNLVSNCGTWFQNIAQSLLVYRLTGSVFLVGVVNFAQFAGVVVLAPWSGMAADRYDRRRLIVGTQSAAVAITASLAVLTAVGVESVPLIIFLAAVLGLVTAFGGPALQAIVPQLVPSNDIGPAVTMTSVSFNLARAVGPVLGALVVGTLGIPWAFALNALSYGALIGAMLVVSMDAGEPRPAGQSTNFLASLQLVRDSPNLLLLFAIVSCVSFSLGPVTTLGPEFATKIFHHPDTVSGYLLGAFGAGAVFAAFVAAGKTATPHRRMASMLVLLVAGSLAFALSPGLEVALLVLPLAGFGYLASQTRATALLMTAVGEHQRGRIMAIWAVCFLGTRPVASLLDGALAQLIGVRLAAILIVLPTAAVTLLVVIKARSFDNP
ncbi:MAG: MFS transporter, partial [Tepidiformaceae bacterium]